MSLLIRALAGFGACTLGFSLYRLLALLYTYSRASALPRYLHATSSWALVTGASDGIGKAFAAELLARGFNVVLHGRNEEKLQRIAKELKSGSKQSIEILVADATDIDQDFTAIQARLQRLPGKLTVLVNNVGGIHAKRIYQKLEGNTSNELINCINTNITFTTCITSALLPLLKANGPALVLNCGSLAATFCPPYISTYAGTKGYINTWSSALRSENMDMNVEVLAVAIGNTISAGNTKDEAGITLTASECAKACLDRVGCGYDVVIPHPRFVLSAIPFWLLSPDFAKRIFSPIIKKRYEAEEKKFAEKSM